ncbi:hypothetical protein [Vibrio vulnificus YJ016]|uniref:Uncharacterized protein n=1 Tax=Vibrio vulnificus (strain YJ016) TaxID=196600 RepID=Q7MQA2_VIBVY|nr:hypothetical protein [Vibrio vulnificus YJ016]
MSGVGGSYCSFGLIVVFFDGADLKFKKVNRGCMGDLSLDEKTMM